jgi:hypothetical protein
MSSPFSNRLAFMGIVLVSGGVGFLLTGCAAPAPPVTVTSPLVGTWQDPTGALIMVIDSTGTVTQESLTWNVLIPADGLLHNTLTPGVAVGVDPYTVTVDAANNVTVSQHNAQEEAGNVIANVTISGTGNLINSNLMTITFVVQGGTVQTQTITFARTAGT